MCDPSIRLVHNIQFSTSENTLAVSAGFRGTDPKLGSLIIVSFVCSTTIAWEKERLASRVDTRKQVLGICFCVLTGATSREIPRAPVRFFVRCWILAEDGNTTDRVYIHACGRDHHCKVFDGLAQTRLPACMAWSVSQCFARCHCARDL